MLKALTRAVNDVNMKAPVYLYIEELACHTLH